MISPEIKANVKHDREGVIYRKKAERLCKCGADLSDRHINTKNCYDCSQEKNYESSARRNKLLRDQGITRDQKKRYRDKIRNQGSLIV